MDFTYQPVERYRAIMALLFHFRSMVCYIRHFIDNYTPQNSVWGVYRNQFIGRSVRRSVCSFLSALFLINYWTNFIQTSQVNSVSSRDVRMKCWLWFIDFLLSYGPFMKFLVRSFSHQVSDRFGSNFTNRFSIKQRCAYLILVMVY